MSFLIGRLVNGFGQQIVWKNVIAFIFLHSSLLYGAYRLFTSPPWLTMFFAFVVGTHSGLGITAGAHRLWSHRAYKAKLPLRIFLAFLQTTAGQVSNSQRDGGISPHKSSSGLETGLVLSNAASVLSFRTYFSTHFLLFEQQFPERYLRMV